MKWNLIGDSEMKRIACVVIAALLGMSVPVLAQDSFGSGANAFTIDFVDVGNAGNADDAGAGGGSFSSPYGGVGYDYRISTYEISQSDITNATASGLSNVTGGPHTGNEPAANISWYEAAAFVNWMNTSNGYQAAYDLSFSSGWTMSAWGASDQASTGVDSGTNPYRHKDAFYFLPSEDEWYKAAYHQNDGVTANYWDYATGSNTAPTAVIGGVTGGTAVYGQSFDTGPADVANAGGLSSYGAMGMNGNVWEWNESAFDGVNDFTNEARGLRGGLWFDTGNSLRPFIRGNDVPTFESYGLGFRVASIPLIPEPSSVIMLLIALGASAVLLRKRFSL